MFQKLPVVLCAIISKVKDGDLPHVENFTIQQQLAVTKTRDPSMIITIKKKDWSILRKYVHISVYDK